MTQSIELDPKGLEAAREVLRTIPLHASLAAEAEAVVGAYLSTLESLPIPETVDAARLREIVARLRERGRLAPDAEWRNRIADFLEAQSAELLDLRARLKAVETERDEAAAIAKRLTKTLTGLSEFFTRSIVLDDYFADAEACDKHIRDARERMREQIVNLVSERKAAEARASEAERQRDDALEVTAGEGWKYVPAEPTEEMLKAGLWAKLGDGSPAFPGKDIIKSWDNSEAVYRAMLDAAPPAPGDDNER